jgi:hypothetical protein
MDMTHRPCEQELILINKTFLSITQLNRVDVIFYSNLIQYLGRHIVFKARRCTLTRDRVLNVCFNEIGKVSKD